MTKVKYNIWYPNRDFKSITRFRCFQSMSFAIIQGVAFLYFFLRYKYGGGEWDLVVIGFYFLIIGTVISVIVYLFVIKRLIPPKAIMFSDEGIFLLNYRNQVIKIPHEKIRYYNLEYMDQRIYLKIYFKESVNGSKEFIPDADQEFIEKLFEYLKSKEIPRKGMPMIEAL